MGNIKQLSGSRGDLGGNLIWMLLAQTRTWLVSRVAHLSCKDWKHIKIHFIMDVTIWSGYYFVVAYLVCGWCKVWQLLTRFENETCLWFVKQNALVVCEKREHEKNQPELVDFGYCMYDFVVICLLGEILNMTWKHNENPSWNIMSLIWGLRCLWTDLMVLIGKV